MFVSFITSRALRLQASRVNRLLGHRAHPLDRLGCIASRYSRKGPLHCERGDDGYRQVVVDPEWLVQLDQRRCERTGKGRVLA